MSISKKLLSEILGYDADPSLTIEIRGEGIFSPGINIHELAHKCKEWAWDKEFELKPSKCRYQKDEEDYKCEIYLKTYWYKDKNQYPEVIFYAGTEPKAIFKACEWILEQQS